MKLIFQHKKTAYSNRLARLIEAERTQMLQYACYRLGSLEDAEDTVQELFVHLHDREPDMPPEQLPRYLYTCLRNLCTDRLRRTPLPTVPLEQLKEMSEEPAPDLEQEIRRIQYRLSTIPDEQAEVIRLRFYGDKGFAEISDLLGLPLATVKSRFRYGLEKLRKDLCQPSN